MLEHRLLDAEWQLEQSRKNLRASVLEAYELCQSTMRRYGELPLYSYTLYKTKISSSGSDVEIAFIEVVLGDSGHLTDDQLLAMAEKIAANFVLVEGQPKAILFSFWNDETSRERHYTSSATVAWAPFGDVTKASIASAEDYSAHEYRVLLNSTDRPSVFIPPSRTTLASDQDIYFELVEMQDRIPEWDSQYQEKNQTAKEEIARKYGLTMGQLNDIIHKGVIEFWPTPTPP